MQVIRIQRLWDASAYNAFTDLFRHAGVFYCVFREASGHLSMDGTLRVLQSRDGRNWNSAARLEWPGRDVREAKITVTPQGLYLLNGAIREESGACRSVVWLSPDAREWGAGREILEPGLWLWRVTWHDGIGYGLAYGEDAARLQLLATADGKEYRLLAAGLGVAGQPSEHAMVFLEDGAAVCLLRRDGKIERNGLLGIAQSPYTSWSWSDLGQYTGGPAMIRIPDGRIIAALRLIDDRQYQRISLCWIDPARGAMSEFLVLPGAQTQGPPPEMGDYGYPGMVWHEGLLQVSYYSSHEEKTCVYLAQVDVS